MDKVIQALLGTLFTDLLSMVYQPMLDGVDSILDEITYPTKIAFVQDLVVYFTVISVVVVVLLRIMIGIKDGLLANGSNTEVSTGEYIFKSCLSLAAVVTAGPLSFWLIVLATDYTNDMMYYSFGATIVPAYSQTLVDIGNTTTKLLAPLVILVSAVLVFIVAFQVGKRWVMMLLGSAVAPVIAIHTAMTDTSNYTGLLKEVMALGIINGLQILLLHFSMALLYTGGTQTGSYASPIIWFFLMGATISIPSFLQRYALPSGSGGGRTGVYILMTGLRSFSSIRGAK